MGVNIVGVGFGDVDTIADWVEDEGFQYEMWSDTEKTLAMAYGAADSKSAWLPDRITVLLDADGNLLLEYLNVSTGTHPNEVFEDCLQLFQ